MSLIHLPSKRSIDITGIRYVNWDEQVFCPSHPYSTISSWHSRTSIYYHTSPETPVVILSNYELYDEDIQALQRELGVPQDTE